MRNKIASFIVHFRYPLMILMLVLSIVSAATISHVRINYDLTSYLSKDTDTKKALAIMDSEFEATSSMSVVLTDAGEEKANGIASLIKAFDGVMSAAHDPQSGLYTAEDGTQNRLISVIMTENSEETVLDQVEELLADVPHLISGGAYDNRVLRESITSEMPLIMLISCVIVFAILLLLTRAYIEPVLFFLVIVVSILLNMGTNWIFSSISFITFAVCAILQLALAMDYSIMLINAFDDRLDAGDKPADAIRTALAGAFMPISSSALTTVAGMLALVFMSFTIGFDIGIVLAKGILLSMLTVFLFMPGLLTLFAPLTGKTAHKPFRMSGKLVAAISQKTRGILPIVLILLIIAGACLQGRTVYTYTVRSMDNRSKQVSTMFGQTNQVVLLFPTDTTDEGYAKQKAMLSEMSAITSGGRAIVQDVYAMVTTGEMAVDLLDAAALAKLTGKSEREISSYVALLGISLPMRGDELITRLSGAVTRLSFLLPAETVTQINDLAALLHTAQITFNGEHYSRALLSLDISFSDPDSAGIVSQIKTILRTYYGDDCGLAGMLPAMTDIATSFSGDIARVSLITIALVFIIVMLSFRSLIIPVMLVCVIQGAIWINMAFSNALDGSVFFMCYLICMALQMGATIDYGILMTNHYRLSRQTLAPREALAQAMDLSMQTILTSGLALIIAGFTVGSVSSVFYISSIGTMLGRGAIISVLLILFLLPQLLLWLDRFIVKTHELHK